MNDSLKGSGILHFFGFWILRDIFKTLTCTELGTIYASKHLSSFVNSIKIFLIPVIASFPISLTLLFILNICIDRFASLWKNISIRRRLFCKSTFYLNISIIEVYIMEVSLLILLLLITDCRVFFYRVQKSEYA